MRIKTVCKSNTYYTFLISTGKWKEIEIPYLTVGFTYEFFVSGGEYSMIINGDIRTESEYVFRNGGYDIRFSDLFMSKEEMRNFNLERIGI